MTETRPRRLAILPMVVGSVPKGDLRGAVFGSGYILRSLVETNLYDEIDLYAPLLAQQRPYEDMVRAQPWLANRSVRVRQMVNLHRFVADDLYDLVFAPSFTTEVAGLATLRAQCDARFRIMSMIYSVSYPDTEGAVLQNLLSPLREDDLLNCTSETGLTAILAIIGSVRRRFGVAVPVKPDMATVPYGIDTAYFRSGDRRRACVQLGLDPDRRYILSLGRFSAVDKFDIGPLVEAFVRAQASLDTPWCLILAGASGQGSYLAWVRLLLQARGLDHSVVIRPDVSEEERLALYRAASFFVAPSDSPQETFGLTAIEAMATGLPVIAADWDGYKETVVHGETGLRIPTYMPRLTGIVTSRYLVDNSVMHLLVAQSVAIDVGRLADAMMTLCQDAAYRERLSSGARRHSETRFDTSTVALALRQVLTIRDNPAFDPSDPTNGTLEDEIPNDVDGSSLWTLFSSFASRSLEASDWLVTSDWGKRGITEVLPVYLTPEMEELLYLELVRPICRACESGAPFGEVRDAMIGAGRDAERVEYTLYWAIKQGMVDVNPPAHDQRRPE